VFVFALYSTTSVASPHEFAYANAMSKKHSHPPYPPEVAAYYAQEGTSPWRGRLFLVLLVALCFVGYQEITHPGTLQNWFKTVTTDTIPRLLETLDTPTDSPSTTAQPQSAPYHLTR
jgi:hypothetical protein